MSLWSDNLSLLRHRFPEAARRVEAARPVAWKMRPKAEADVLATRWLSGRRVNVHSLLAVSGWGDGAHVRALLGVVPAGCVVFVGEDDPGLFRAALEQADFRDLLGDERLLLGVGEPNEAFFRPFAADHVTRVFDIVPLLYAPSFNSAPERYARFFTEFARHVDFRRKLEGTRIVDAALWQQNSFENLPLLGPAADIGALAGLFRGRPAVIVSAGPSLDESLDFLRQVQAHAVIIAGNSSYRAVRNAGVVPHLVLAADPRIFTLKGLETVAVDGSWLVTTPIVHPGVPRLFGSRIVTWSGANPLMTEVRRRCGLAPGSVLVEQGTISATAIDVALVLGCDRVCLVGQDLAVLPDGRSHVRDSFYTDTNSNRVDVSKCRRLPGNTVPEVLVEEKLFVYLKTFEQMAAHRPTLRFRNTSRLGAKIEGMPYVDFEGALRWLGRKPIGDVPVAIEKRARTGTNDRALGRDAVTRALEPTAVYARDVLALALRCAAKCEAVALDDKGEVVGEGGAAEDALEVASALDARVYQEPAEWSVLEAGRTRMELFQVGQLQTDLGKYPATTAALLRARETAWAFAEGAWFLLSCLDRLKADSGPSAGAENGT